MRNTARRTDTFWGKPDYEQAMSDGVISGH